MIDEAAIRLRWDAVGSRLDERGRRLFAAAEVRTLVESVAGAHWLDVRDRAILELLYGAGVRVSELVGSNIEDMDLERGLLRVRGKGKKERMAPIGNGA